MLLLNCLYDRKYAEKKESSLRHKNMKYRFKIRVLTFCLPLIILGWVNSASATNITVCTGAVSFNGSQPVFNWTTSGDSQSGYQVYIYNNIGSLIYDSGMVLNASQSMTGPVLTGGNYSWAVRVLSNVAPASWTSFADGGTFSVNYSPSAINLSASQPNYCLIGPAATFSWTFSDSDAGDTQSAYQVQVATNPGFSGPGTVVDSNKVSSASNSYATGSGKLVYDTKYYWRVKVWDNHDLVSGWASGADFTTPKHTYPTVNFSWTPLNSSVNEDVSFVDQSTVFGGAIKSAWFWTFQDGSPASSVQENSIVKFLSNGTKQVVLQITDSDNYSCSSNKTVGIRLPLPGWKEVAP